MTKKEEKILASNAEKSAVGSGSDVGGDLNGKLVEKSSKKLTEQEERLLASKALEKCRWVMATAFFRQQVLDKLESEKPKKACKPIKKVTFHKGTKLF